MTMTRRDKPPRYAGVVYTIPDREAVSPVSPSRTLLWDQVPKGEGGNGHSPPDSVSEEGRHGDAHHRAGGADHRLQSQRLPGPHLPDRPEHGHALPPGRGPFLIGRERRLRHRHQRRLRLAAARPHRAAAPTATASSTSAAPTAPSSTTRPSQGRRLKDGDYLRVGNCIYRFLAGGNIEAEYHEEIYRLTIIDALTEIHNKRYLLEFLDRELARAARHGRPLSLVLFDIDHFKAINDELRPPGRRLRRCASWPAASRKCVRKDELFARYGGEEFAVVLPETPTARRRCAVAERVRALVAGHAVRVRRPTGAGDDQPGRGATRRTARA